MLELTVYRVNTINQLLNCAAIIFVDRFNRGVDKQIPVDVYLPGCPPKQEEVLDAITKLRKKVSREIYEEGPKVRCFTTHKNHHVGRSTHTGNYDQG